MTFVYTGGIKKITVVFGVVFCCWFVDILAQVFLTGCWRVVGILLVCRWYFVGFYGQ